MMENKKILAYRTMFVVLGLLVIGGVVSAYSGGTPKVVVEGDFIEAQAPVEERLGAFPGPDLNVPYLSINGVTSYYTNTGMTQAASTTSNVICAFPPVIATSTIERFSYNMHTGTGTAATLIMATSTLSYATSTNHNILASHAVAADTGNQADWTTVGDGVNDNQLTPDLWVIVATESAGLGTGYIYGGDCSLTTTEY